MDDLLFRAEPATGRCYVLTFSPKHNVTLADMSVDAIREVVETWTHIYATHLAQAHPLADEARRVLSALSPPPEGVVSRPASQLRYMQIFENKGAAMGCSNPHPHCQIWTTSSLPEEPARELAQLGRYRRERGGRHMLEDYAKREILKEERVVWQNDAFVTVCPWWAVWPFEVMIIAKSHARALVDLGAEERAQFAEAIQDVARRYDNLFKTTFPYSMDTGPRAARQGLTRPNQVPGFTRRRCAAARTRSRAAGCTCTSTRRCSGQPPSGSSSSGTRCWPSRNGTSRPSRRQHGSGRAAGSCTARTSDGRLRSARCNHALYCVPSPAVGYLLT